MRWTSYEESEEEKEAIANLRAGKDVNYLEGLLQGLRKRFWVNLVLAVIVVSITRTVGFVAFYLGEFIVDFIQMVFDCTRPATSKNECG